MSSHEQQAQTLIEALPYIQKFTGKTIVVKYGGNAMISDELRRAVMSDIILLNLVGIRVVAVHGGGPEISAMLKMIGHESKFCGRPALYRRHHHGHRPGPSLRQGEQGPGSPS